MSYEILTIEVVATSPLTVQWTGSITRSDASVYTADQLGTVVLCAVFPDPPAGWVDYTPDARTALAAITDPTDDAAILAAVDLDAARVEAEREADIAPSQTVARSISLGAARTKLAAGNLGGAKVGPG